jgi:cyclase
MLLPRIIPSLLVHDGGLVKTVRFKDPKYVGDPINAVRIFNEKEADEILVLDIEATYEGRGPDFDLVRDLAEECRMPLCFGGGITTVGQMERIIAFGTEKVAVSAAAIVCPSLVTEAARHLGNQSVVVVLDVKRRRLTGRYQVRTHRGKQGTGLDPLSAAKEMADRGAGEIVVNSIDREGTGSGYPKELVQAICEQVPVPVTALGGAGSMEDVVDLFSETDASGAAAGSLFVFKGVHRAVLINYPSWDERDDAYQRIRAKRTGSSGVG